MQEQTLAIHRSPLGILRRVWPLLIGLGLILFPFGWLGERWPAFGELLGMVFNTVRAHAIGHAILFFMLGLLALLTFPALRRRPWLYFGLMLLVALGQEGFQLAYKLRPLVFDDARDIVVDLVAAAAAFGVGLLLERTKNREQRTKEQERNQT